MKKLVFGLLLCFVLSMNCFFQPHEYKNIRPKVYNDILKKTINTDGWLAYDTEKDIVIMYFEDSLATVAYELKKKDRAKMIAAIDKYEEWNDKAIQKQVTLSKTIDEIKLKGSFEIWEWRFSYKKTSVSFDFFSENTDSHLLALRFEELKDWTNEFITYTPQSLYFDYVNATELRDALKEENIKRLLEDIGRKKQIEDEFE